MIEQLKYESYAPKEYEKVLGEYEPADAGKCLSDGITIACSYHEFGFRSVTLLDGTILLVASNKDDLNKGLWQTMRNTN